jgi:hypothetical protein
MTRKWRGGALAGAAAAALCCAAGCGTAAPGSSVSHPVYVAPAPPPAVTPSLTPAPGPQLKVSAAYGCVYSHPETDDMALFAPGGCTAATENATQWDYGYEVTVTNNNAFAVDISSVEVAFYDASGNELSQGSEGLGIIQIAADHWYRELFQGCPAGTASVTAESWSQ